MSRRCWFWASLDLSIEEVLSAPPASAKGMPVAAAKQHSGFQASVRNFILPMTLQSARLGTSKDGLLPVMEATHQILGTRDRVELRRMMGMTPKHDLTHQRTTWSGQP
jgi:hypothetical protein